MKYFSLSILFFCTFTWAAPYDKMTLLGSARFSYLFWDIYDVWLYSGNESLKNNEDTVLKIRYLKDISAEELVKNTASEWKKLELNHPLKKQWLEQLKEVWPDIQAQDELMLQKTKNGESQFYYNNKVIGPTLPPPFGQRFLAIWLSPNCSYPDIRQKLIGIKS